MTINQSASAVMSGLVYHHDTGNTKKSWLGQPTTNISLINGQSGTNPWGGDTVIVNNGISPYVKFRNRAVSQIKTGNSGNCYLTSGTKLSTAVASTAWTTTIYAKRMDGVPITSAGGYLYVSNNTNVNAAATITQVEEGWTKTVYTRSGLASGVVSLVGLYGFPINCDLLLASWQVEPLAYSTPYVDTSRSVTGSLLDLTGNNSIDVTAGHFNSDGSVDFNSTTGFNCGNSAALQAISGTNNVTVEAWVYITGMDPVSGYDVITHKGAPWAWLMENPTQKMRIRFTLGGSDVNCQDPNTHSLNTWYQFVGSYDGFNMRLYRNGVLVNTVAHTGTLGGSGASMVVGNYYNTFHTLGQIPVIKIYNRTLSDNEVSQNFNALRGRFGL